MSIFTFRWLRQFIRKNTSPIPGERAYTWKNRLSLMYMLLAWNGFGFVLYMIYTGKSEWMKTYQPEELSALTPAQQWCRTLGIKNAKVVRVSGLNVTNYEIHNSFEEKKENLLEQDEDETGSNQINGNEALNE